MATESKLSPTILVLEDDPNLREMLVLVLREAGFGVVGAESVGEALKIASDAVPDMVLVDIMMPRVDGLNLVRALRTGSATPLCDVPIVALSGLDQAEWREAARAAGCNEFIAKPVMPDQLIAVVRRHTRPAAGT